MTIDWHALFTVLAVTLVSTVGLVGVFTLGIVGLSRRATTTSGSTGTSASTPAAVLTRTGAYLCFAACAAAVAWGIYLIVQK